MGVDFYDHVLFLLIQLSTKVDNGHSSPNIFKSNYLNNQQNSEFKFGADKVCIYLIFKILMQKE